MLKQVIAIAKESGKVILSHYKSDLKVDFKNDLSPLTLADTQANRVITEGLLKLDPSIPVISEEAEVPDYAVRKRWKRFWLVDPLDGTKEFIKKADEFTVNIGLVNGGVPVLGVVLAPALDLLYGAEKGKGSWKWAAKSRPDRIYYRAPDKKGPLVVVESRFHSSPDAEEYYKTLPSIERITVGSSLKFCYLAEGKAHLYPRFAGSMEWDVAAGDCIWRNAVRDGEGPNESPLTYNKPELKNGSFILGRHHL
jgi:3'(2'), 5'-bisphosphate nucleotidase